MLKRLFGLFLAFTVLFFVCTPAFATGMTPGGIGGGVTGIPVVGEIQLDVVEFAEFCRDDLRYVYNSVRHWLDEDICPYAPQASGGHNFVPRRTMVDGQIGKYYVCEYCGKAYGDALEEAYDEYVGENMGDFSAIDSSGYLGVNLPITGFFFAGGTSFYYYEGTSAKLTSGANRHGVEPYSTDSYLNLSLSSSGSSGRTDYFSYSGLGSSSLSLRTLQRLMWFRDGCTCVFSVIPPVSGLLYLSPDSLGEISLFPAVLQASLSTDHWEFAPVSSQSFSVPSSVYNVEAGVPVEIRVSLPHLFYSSAGGGSDVYTVQFSLSTSVSGFFEPFSSVSPVYSPDFRVGGNLSDSGTGSYGYVQDGQLYQSTTRDIFNETTNTYNNPVTGDTSNIENWTYDYSDRSYTLTTDEGDTVTVTYGDTNVTINDGGTTYNVYYLTEHDDSIPEHNYVSSVTLAPTCTGTGIRTYTCTECDETYTEIIPATGHSYQSVVTMPPTCINTGVKTFTCSACGDSYTQLIPATGHTWTVTKTVPNQYDDGTGQLTQAGYTLYTCSTCGEQYRIDAASSGETLPSPSTGGTSIDTGDSGGEALTPDIDSSVGRGFLATIAHGLTEDLPEVLKLISEWFKTVPALYDGYSKFLAASFAWMPPDCVMLLTFGVGMVTVIAICRAMFRR